MMVDNLNQTVSMIRTYQKICPETYGCIEDELKCLIGHIGLVVKYLEQSTEGAPKVSLPNTINELKGLN